MGRHHLSSRAATLVPVILILLFSWLHENRTRSIVANALTSSVHPSSKIAARSTDGSRLDAAKRSRSYFQDDDDDMERQKRVDRPTETKTEREGPPTSPSKPKIVVLGATGRIGRLVIQEVMEMSQLDCTIVALVRNYEEALAMFYGEGDACLIPRNKSRGPQLEIVQGDLVPPEDLPGQVGDEEELVEEEEWQERAQSAALFYGVNSNDYDNRVDSPKPTSIHETLESAIKDCTTIISCVGSVRPTNVWTDLLRFPLWRLLRKDVSGWCRDKRHPYYVHYATTRKVLGLAESEQRRRQAAADADAEQKEKDRVRVPRIRLIRISDLCVAHRAWDFVPLITNALQSMVFRYQDMAERIMDESNVIDTVVLRPGDLMDEDRDTDTTSLQVDSSGRVPSPARVGRADVASLAIAAALFTDNESISSVRHSKQQQVNQTAVKDSSDEPFHFTLAVRWAGQELHPYPPQGNKNDGFADAQQCMRRVLKTESQKAKRRRRLRQKSAESSSLVKLGRALMLKRRPLKPYGICVAIFAYFFLGLFITSLTKSLLGVVPGGEHVMTALSRARAVLWGALMTRIRRDAAVLPPPIEPTKLRFRQRLSKKSYISF